MARRAAAPPADQNPPATIGSAMAGSNRVRKNHRFSRSRIDRSTDVITAGEAEARHASEPRRAPAVAPARTRPRTRSGERAATSIAT